MVCKKTSSILWPSYLTLFGLFFQYSRSLHFTLEFLSVLITNDIPYRPKRQSEFYVLNRDGVNGPEGSRRPTPGNTAMTDVRYWNPVLETLSADSLRRLPLKKFHFFSDRLKKSLTNNTTMWHHPIYPVITGRPNSCLYMARNLAVYDLRVVISRSRLDWIRWSLPRDSGSSIMPGDEGP